MAGDTATIDDDLQAGAQDEAEQQAQQADEQAADAAPQPEGDADGAEAAAGEGAANDDADAELVVTLGDEPAADAAQDKAAPDWVRDLRKANREKERRIRELEAQIASARPVAPQAVVVGEKPTLADHDFDEDKFAAALEAWHGRKFAAEQQQRAAQQAEEQQRQHWMARLDAVTKAAGTLKVPDAEDAHAAFEDTFNVVQQGIIIGAPDDPKTSALLRYALGKNPKKARELAAITDPVKFTFAIAKLEGQLKVQPKKSAPPPDQRVSSPGAGVSIVQNGRLKQLHEQAQRTGDYTAYLAAKRAARQAA